MIGTVYVILHSGRVLGYIGGLSVLVRATDAWFLSPRRWRLVSKHMGYTDATDDIL